MDRNDRRDLVVGGTLALGCAVGGARSLDAAMPSSQSKQNSFAD